MVRLEIKAAQVDDHGLTGEVIATDGPFGNLVTNVRRGRFSEARLPARQKMYPLTLGDREMKIKFVRTFSDVALKEPLLYIDSRGRLGLAVNQGSFAATYGIRPPLELSIPRQAGH